MHAAKNCWGLHKKRVFFDEWTDGVCIQIALTTFDFLLYYMLLYSQCSATSFDFFLEKHVKLRNTSGDGIREWIAVVGEKQMKWKTALSMRVCGGAMERQITQIHMEKKSWLNWSHS